MAWSRWIDFLSGREGVPDKRCPSAQGHTATLRNYFRAKPTPLLLEFFRIRTDGITSPMISMETYQELPLSPPLHEEAKFEHLELGVGVIVPMEIAEQHQDNLEMTKPQARHWSDMFSDLWNEIIISGNMNKTQKYLCNFQGTKTPPLTLIMICFDLILRGISQVYLCDHPISGLLIAIGVGLSSCTLLLHGVLGVMGSTLGATVVCRLPYSKISNGLVGYDGALVGCAIYSFCVTGNENSLLLVTFFLSAISGILHMSLANILGLAKLPPFTAAFNVTVFCLLLGMAHNNTRIAAFRPTDSSIDYSAGFQDQSFLWFITMAVKGVGQFMFADTIAGATLVIIGILLQSRRDGFCAVLGAFVGGITARYVLSLPSSHTLAISSGLYGYNAAGTCVVLGGGRFYSATNSAYVIGIIGAIMSVYIQIMYESLFVVTAYQSSNSTGDTSPESPVVATDHIPVLISLPVLTFPFITTAWLMMLTQSTWLHVRSNGTEESENLAPSRVKRGVAFNRAFLQGVQTIKRVASYRNSLKGSPHKARTKRILVGECAEVENLEVGELSSNKNIIIA
jgi:urea transporter